MALDYNIVFDLVPKVWWPENNAEEEDFVKEFSWCAIDLKCTTFGDFQTIVMKRNSVLIFPTIV